MQNYLDISPWPIFIQTREHFKLSAEKTGPRGRAAPGCGSFKKQGIQFSLSVYTGVHRSILAAKDKPCFFKRTKPCASLMQDTPYFQGKNSGKAALSKIRPPTLGHLFGKCRKPPRPSGNVSGSTGSIPDPRAMFREVPKASPTLGHLFGRCQKLPRSSGVVSGSAEIIPDPRA